jgi:hypothetical protein
VLPENATIRVLLANEHQLVRSGVKALLQTETDLELIGEPDNFAETLHLTRQLSPDVVLFEVMLSDGNSAERIPELLHSPPPDTTLANTPIGNALTPRELAIARLAARGLVAKKSPRNFSSAKKPCATSWSSSTASWACIATSNWCFRLRILVCYCPIDKFRIRDIYPPFVGIIAS